LRKHLFVGAWFGSANKLKEESKRDNNKMSSNNSNASTTSMAIGLGVLTAVMTLITTGSVGILGFMIGRQLATQSLTGKKNSTSTTEEEKEPEHGNIIIKSPTMSIARRFTIPSGSASEDVKISDKKALVDVRITGIRPLIPPACLLEEIPLTPKMAQTINLGRQGVSNILRRVDDRLVVVVGPCSIHDIDAAIEYANKLVAFRKEVEEDLLIIMRVYFEKPRTTVGWKGLINDPDLNGTFNINKGLRIARELLAEINDIGLPAGCEFLDTMSPQFFSDLVAWGAIGARTTECQLHRELTSGLSMPIGFKNGTGGSLQLAVDAVVAARHPHCFLSVSSQGLASIVNTKGNDCCHTILRGGKTGPNYTKEYIDEVSTLMLRANLTDNVMVDCSHGNSKKDYKNQPLVAFELAKQIAKGDERIIGVMIESNLQEGNQKLLPEQPLEYGKSVTDACINWETTTKVLKELAVAVRERRKTKTNKAQHKSNTITSAW
jgi:3-deoxy-7-phosphoheptulonate synthase